MTLIFHNLDLVTIYNKSFLISGNQDLRKLTNHKHLISVVFTYVFISGHHKLSKFMILESNN